MTTKIQNLQNKTNDKTLTLEEREDRFLDLQIEEILLTEKEEKRYLKKVDSIINNLDNKNYSFEIKYFIDEDNYYSNFFKILYKKNNTQNYKIFYINESTFFNSDYSFLKDEYLQKLFKHLENQKNQNINDDDEESEF